MVYVHAARRPLALGKLDVSLDNLIGSRVRPVIGVFLPSLIGGGYEEYVGSRRDEYLWVFRDEVVPLVDRTYRTIPTREGRTNVRRIYGAFMAFYATFTHPDLSGNLAIQLIWWDPQSEADHGVLIVPASTQPPLRIYLDCGRYDIRSQMEGNDLGRSTEAFARLLKERGYSFAGGEMNDGAGWARWKNRTDRLFETLFPISDGRFAF